MPSDPVSNGTLLLDSTTPGWHHRINLSYLDITDPYACMLAQTHGSYAAGLVALTGGAPPRARLGRLLAALREWLWPTWRTEWAIRHGFAVRDTGDDTRNAEAYDRLTREWGAEIQRRRDEGRENAEAETMELVKS